MASARHRPGVRARRRTGRPGLRASRTWKKAAVTTTVSVAVREGDCMVTITATGSRRYHNRLEHSPPMTANAPSSGASASAMPTVPPALTFP
ncbi:hypothetical protein JKP76_03370 [Blastococcus sp. TML/C7B]|uniref:hypothetical protein n=1 Tax=Blastococcus sp. TML/C7B TaxID=2798728 RepID=UPI00190D3EBB|nr:hypothetical protein [Blastococcus sp. TML/C7B]MBN1095157.1 hypothetical protein [Blastococcus sp. TML/C7B]